MKHQVPAQSCHAEVHRWANPLNNIEKANQLSSDWLLKKKIQPKITKNQKGSEDRGETIKTIKLEKEKDSVKEQNKILKAVPASEKTLYAWNKNS